MEVVFGLIIFLLSILAFIFFYKREKRSLLIALPFFIVVGSFLLFLLTTMNVARPLFMVGAVLVILLLIFIPLYLLSSIVVLIKTGIDLVKKEGFSLSHILSFGLGVFILAYTIIYPLVYGRINNRYLINTMDFLSSLVGYFYFLLVLFIFSSLLNLIPNKKRNYKYIIVLGSGLIDGNVTPLLKSRINKGLVNYRRIKERGYDCKLIMSGGQGDDEARPEAHAMREYALLLGVDPEDIIVEDRSTSTEENLNFSLSLIRNLEGRDFAKDKTEILITTNNYHVFRSLVISKDLGIKADGQGGKTKLYYWLNAAIREFIALIYMNISPHLFVLALFLVNFLVKMIADLIAG